MPKGRGARRGKKRKPQTPAAGSTPKGIVGGGGLDPERLRKLQHVAEAGGFTREERRRARQRKEEEARLAARRVARAANKKGEQ